MSLIKLKKDELDLIRSIFTSEELIFTDEKLIRDFDHLFEKGDPQVDLDIHLTLKLNFPDIPASVNLAVTLPTGYPMIPPSILLRVDHPQSTLNEKQLSNALSEWMSTSLVTEEPAICLVVDWLRSAMESNAFLRNNRPEPEVTNTPVASALSKGSEVCYWIFSHHIRNPKKRKVIVDWARELYLTGCCLPGKPGIVVVEGDSDNVEEYWKRIKVLTWKRIQLKDREEIQERRFTDGFFEVGGSLADKVGHLRRYGVSQERIAVHFGFNP